MSSSSTAVMPHKPKIWWSNSIFFLSIHVAAVVGVYYWPFYAVPRATLILSVMVWQLADFGLGTELQLDITDFGPIGHFAQVLVYEFFWQRWVLRVSKAQSNGGVYDTDCIMFTDDPIHDPYAATRGLFYSHVGWIFYKPTYERMELVDRRDLDSDPVVRFQHQHYVPLALFFGFVVPTLIGASWGDATGAFVWGGLVSRLAIWHCTFMVNSLAHWDGLQPFSDEDTSRGNLILALLTGGEGNHNFVELDCINSRMTEPSYQHAFPHDFRSGPSLTDWDPSKWIVLGLHRLGLATGLRRAREGDMKEAAEYMKHKGHYGVPPPPEENETRTLEVWPLQKVEEFARENPKKCLIMINEFLVDATAYLGEHPGGAVLLRNYSLRLKDCALVRPDASWAFEGGLNNHSRAAQRRMRELRIAKTED